MHWWGERTWQEWHWLMMLGMAVFWIAVIIALALLLRYLLASSRRDERSEESPEDILKRRFARGEIDEDEYRRRLAGLKKDRPD